MSTRSSIRSLLLLGISLATTSVAFARNPPALVQSQEVHGRVVAGSGYRDSLTRAGKRELGVESARAGSGYRDWLVRFASRTPLRIASSR